MLTKFKLIFFVIVIGILSCGCNSVKKNSTESSIIEGNIQNSTGAKIYFCTYPDTQSLFLGNKIAIDSSLVDEKGDFSFTLKNKTTNIFNLESGRKILVTNLFLIPGSQLKINFTGKNNKPEIISSGSESEFNKYLIQFLDSFYQDPAINHEYYIATNYMDIHEFTIFNDRRKQKQLDFYSNYFKDQKINNDFRNYALNTINYGIAVDRLMYLWKKRMKNENVFADSSYFAFETPSFIENIDAFNCPAYIRFLNLYIKDSYERMVERGELPRNKSDVLVPPVEKYHLALQLLNKPYCNVVLYNILYNDMKDISKDNSIDSLSAKSLNSMIDWFCRKHSIVNLKKS